MRIVFHKDLVRFYVNSERKEFSFITFTQDTNNLKILEEADPNTIPLSDKDVISKIKTTIEIFILNFIIKYNFFHIKRSLVTK